MLRTRFHPYLHSSASVAELSSPLNFNERIEAYDQYNHDSMRFVGYLRQYNSKRNLLSQLKSEVAHLERQLIETHRKLVGDGRTLALLVPDLPSESEEDDENESEVEDNDSDDLTLTRGDNTSTPPVIVDLTSYPSVRVTMTDTVPEIVEKVTDSNGVESIVSCVARTRYAVGAVPFRDGIRSRFFVQLVNCTLCEDVFREHYKCSNYDCVARVCALCLLRIQSTPKKCPFCCSKYELPPLTERMSGTRTRETSPSYAPPAALSQEF
jgi:hypothetical protein